TERADHRLHDVAPRLPLPPHVLDQLRTTDDTRRALLEVAQRAELEPRERNPSLVDDELVIVHVEPAGGLLRGDGRHAPAEEARKLARNVRASFPRRVGAPFQRNEAR